MLKIVGNGGGISLSVPIGAAAWKIQNFDLFDFDHGSESFRSNAVFLQLHPSVAAVDLSEITCERRKNMLNHGSCNQ